MTESRWWSFAVVATGIVLSALVLLEHPSVPRMVGAIGATAVLVAVWLVLGKRAIVDRRAGLIVAIAFIILASVSVGFASSMATIQCVVYPVIWTVLDRTRTAIIANVALALAIGTGFFLGLG
ncbi:MAG TPA: hypothetical protein VK537_03145, partial [Galbitalea sp.]|nr:hypothetical protein [Galbitalea sp.]